MARRCNETPVVFRKYKNGDVIALFPTMHEGNYMINSYMHVGQHGCADYNLVYSTKPATEGEYRELLEELKQIGYENLKVYKRFSPKYD